MTQLTLQPTIQEFEVDYAFERGQNPFHRMLAQGRLISKVTIEHCPEQDDNTALVEFSEPDPAISPVCAQPTSE